MEADTNSTDHIIASGATDAPQVTAVVSKKRNPCNKSFNLTLGAWNVRTTNDNDDSKRLERATAIIGIDTCALSEVRRPGIGNTIKRKHTGAVVTREKLGWVSQLAKVYFHNSE